MSQEETLFSSTYLSLHRRDGWDFVTRRPKATGVVAVLAITDQDEIVLVEQYRKPVQARVVEICAGLVGDEPEFANESLADTAHRELLEETGYEAGKMIHLISSPTSPGMTDEMTHFFLATHLIKTGTGGGISSEDIEVHLVPKEKLAQFLKRKQINKRLIDAKIHAALKLSDRDLVKLS